MSRDNPIKRIFDLYTSDLSFKEIEKLIKQESSIVYEYFARDIPSPDENKSKFVRILIFLRNLFNAFLMKLSPARRIFYLVALFFFLIGYFQNYQVYQIAGFVIINALVVYELFDKLSLKDEVSIARKIQKNLIPQEAPKNDHYEIASYYESAREVSGDYYDFIPNGGTDRTYIVIGDISGKGIPAALYMVRVQAIIHTLVGAVESLKDLLSGLKNNFTKKLEAGYFLTVILAAIEKDGNISICSAGHNPALIYRKQKDEFEFINPKGMGIGFKDGGMFEQVLEEEKVETETGDFVYLYTDGVVEAMNKYRDQYGIEKIKNIIKINSDKSANEVSELIKASIGNFRGDAVIHDDLTMILLKKN